MISSSHNELFALLLLVDHESLMLVWPFRFCNSRCNLFFHYYLRGNS